MIQQLYLQQIIDQQHLYLQSKKKEILRDQLNTLPDIDNFVLIVSGVRRCGKSTLLHQLLQEKYKDALYVNFDDPRLFDMAISDFVNLDTIIEEKKYKVLMFDEIQIISGWERYVRQKLDEGFKVFVSGSNASLLSRELGTTLTGRHITKELFPFSYSEFCRFKEIEADDKSVLAYMQEGGFPEFLKTQQEDILVNLFDDVLVRDIAVRYGIKDIRSLKRLAVYLLSNIGNLTSANKLREPSGISSTTTVLEYISHLEQSYLVQLVPLFNHSLKKQIVNPKKIYAIDLGMVNANVSQLKNDEGHKLENMVFNALRLKHKEIYYHKGKCECDFVVVNKNDVCLAVQVCLQLTNDNQERELKGLKEAMELYNLESGIIVTLNQQNETISDGKKINIIPAYKFLNEY